MNGIRINESFKNILPRLRDDEYKQLEESILNEGVRDPLVVWGKVVIDGHHRYKIATKHNISFDTVEKEFANEIEAKIWIIDNNMARRNLTDFQKYETFELKRKLLKEKGREKQKETQLIGGYKSEQKSVLSKSDKTEKEPHDSREEIAKDLGWSQGKVAQADVVSKKANESTKEKLRKGDISIYRAYKIVKKEERKQKKIESPPLPEGEYNVIYADPPWRYDFSETAIREIENHYPTMELEDIKQLQIPASDNSVLLLWATAPKLREALEVMEVWGFEYKTNAVWDKSTPSIELFERQGFNRQGYSREAFLYLNGYSCSEIAGIMNLSEWTICDRLHRQGIKTNSHKKNNVALTKRQKEILDGEMLGNNCLRIGNDRLQWRLKHLEHIQLLSEEFAEFEPEYSKGGDLWQLYTRVNEDLTRQYKRWYRNNTKRAPDDLEMTPLTCFHWYINAGYLQKSGGIELFAFQEEEFLIKKFAEVGIKAKLLKKEGKGNGFYIGKESAKMFLEYIGHPRLLCYGYKWGISKRDIEGGNEYGLGYWFRGQHELLLVGVKGNFPVPIPENRFPSIIRERRMEHSAKPTVVYKMIERMFPEGRYLELFARSKYNDKWSVWGNEIEN